ncbi:MAG: ankyrin repeat domain-containing protein [Verrucomicrobiota bacterium]
MGWFGFERRFERQLIGLSVDWFVGCLAALLFVGSGVVVAEDKGEGLREAVYMEEVAKAKGLIEAGADVNGANRYGVTALSLACQNGNVALVKALLEAGADANGALLGGETVLMTAARTGEPRVLRALLGSGAEVDATERKGQTALMWAAAEGNVEAVKVLLDAGAKADREVGSGFTAMLFAARAGHIGVVEVLLAAGVDVNVVAKAGGSRGGKALPKGSSALRVAVENGHFDLAKVLLEAGADADDARSGYAPLHVLTWVRKPNRGDGPDGMPPPEGTGELRSLEFARLLVEDYGADVDLRLRENAPWGAKFGTDGATPFLMAARKADLAYLKLLEEMGADVSAADDDGTTAFLLVSGVESRVPEEEAGTETERLAVLDWLAKRGIDVNEANEKKETAMHGAAYKNVPKVVRWLADHEADVAVWNRENSRGWTPLLIAQGFRPGNFKPDAATIEAIENVMREAGVEPPPAPERTR